MISALKQMFHKDNRVIALVFQDGTVQIFDKKSIGELSIISDYINEDLSLVGDHTDSIQTRTVDLYEDSMVYPQQTLYSIPYDIHKRPERTPLIPESVWKTVWNFLEGAKGEVTAGSPHTFKIKASV